MIRYEGNLMPSQAVRALARVIAAAAVTLPLAACSSKSSQTSSPASSGPAPVSQSPHDQGPPTLRHVVLPAPTCVMPPSYTGLQAHYTRSKLDTDLEHQGFIAQESYQASISGAEENNVVVTRGAGVSGNFIDYSITDCQQSTPKLSLAYFNDAYQVPSQPKTFTECLDPRPPSTIDFDDGSTHNIPVTKLIGKKICAPLGTDEVFYFEVAASGSPNANHAPDLAISYALYYPGNVTPAPTAPWSTPS